MKKKTDGIDKYLMEETKKHGNKAEKAIAKR
jgi:hypothetical protein